MSLPVAILVGGKGTRLGAETAHRPKSLVDVAGKPFLEHQLTLLRIAGIREVFLLTGHLSEQFEPYAGEYKGQRIRLLKDAANVRGTGDAIRNATPIIGREFMVLYGDSYLECDYIDVMAAFIDTPKPLMVAMCVDVNAPGFGLTDYGVSMVAPARLRGGFAHYGDYFPAHARRNELAVYVMPAAV